MSFRLKAKIVKNNFPAVRGEIRTQTVRVVNDTAAEVESIAKQLAPVETGRLRDSIHTENYRNGELKRVVAEAEYAGYVEYGTVHSAAQPFLRPAVESVKSRVNRRLGQIEKGLGRKIRG